MFRMCKQFTFCESAIAEVFIRFNCFVRYGFFHSFCRCRHFENQGVPVSSLYCVYIPWPSLQTGPSLAEFQFGTIYIRDEMIRIALNTLIN